MIVFALLSFVDEIKRLYPLSVTDGEGMPEAGVRSYIKELV